MNPVIINLLEKEGYSDFGSLSDVHNGNIIGMCFIKNEHIFFYKENGDEISYEELYELRQTNLIVLEFSKIEKTYTISEDYITTPSQQDWQNKTKRGAFVVNVKNGTFAPLHEYNSYRYPLAIEYKHDLLLVSSSDVIVELNSSIFIPCELNGELYSVNEENESKIMIDTFYAKWNGMYLKELRDCSYNDERCVSIDKDILTITKDVILWKTGSGNIWLLTNYANNEESGFYAISVETQTTCKLSDQIFAIEKNFIHISKTHDSIWIYSLKRLIRISEKSSIVEKCCCVMSDDIKLSYNHSLITLSNDYAIFKDELGPTYYIYDLNSLLISYDDCCYPTDEVYLPSDCHHSAKIGQNNLYGLISIDNGVLLVPQKYDGIDYWESDGNVYSIVKINSRKCNIADNDQETVVFEGLYVNDCILIPPCCKKIERWITDKSDHHMEGNMMYKGYENAGYIVFTTFNDTLGLCYNNEILEQESISEIKRLGLEYAIVVKHEESTLYHFNKKLFTERCKGYKHFSEDLLLMIGDNDQCGLITYDGKLKLPIGNHNLSHLSFRNDEETIALVVDCGNNIFDSRDMHPLLSSPELHFIDANVSFVGYASREHLCIACYEENEEKILFVDIDGKFLEAVSASYEHSGNVLVVPCDIPVHIPQFEGETIVYNQESKIVYDVFDTTLKRFITKDVYQRGYEITRDTNSNIIIRKRVVEPIIDEEEEADSHCTSDSVGDWSFADAELEDFKDNWDPN